MNAPMQPKYITQKPSLGQRRKGRLSLTAKLILPTSLLATAVPLGSQAEFALNFQSNPNVIPSMANVSCNGGGGGMMDGGMMDGMGGMGNMGMMGGGGCGSTPFMQELVDDNGIQYYHIIIGDETQDFAMEFYMRAGGCCWWPNGGGGMGGMGGGMMGGGDAPFSSSYGDINDPFANAFEPLAGSEVSGSGTGNPNRVYGIQITNDGEMNQTYLKEREANKPRITQAIADGSVQIGFDLDMSNGGYNNFSNPALFVNTLDLNEPGGVGDFDMATDAPQANVTAGEFSYAEGTGHGGSFGTYTYSEGGYDVYSEDWLSYCDPTQNPDHNCSFNTGGGGMMGGMGGMGGM